MSHLDQPAPATPPALQGNYHFAMSLALLVLRLVLGWTFIYHGSQKLFGAFGATGMMDSFKQWLESMHLPVLPSAAWAYVAACGEFFGGLFVLLGLLTRLATLPILATMFVAIAEVHGPIGFSNATGAGLPGYEFNMALVAMAVALLLAGPGLISADAVLFKRGLWARGPQPLDQPGKRS